jgi:hypothetical protein
MHILAQKYSRSHFFYFLPSLDIPWKHNDLSFSPHMIGHNKVCHLKNLLFEEAESRIVEHNC